MGLLSTVTGWLRPRAATPAPGDDFWYQPVGSGTSGAGIVVTPDIALKASAVYACIKVLAETIATLPLAMYRELPDGGREAFPDHPLDEIIRFQPNATQTAIEFWEMMVLHAALRGTGYAEIVPGRRGAVDKLLPLHPDRIKVERLPDESLRFEVTDPRTGERRFLLQEEMFRIPGLSSDGVTGLRAVDLAAEDIGIGLAADQYAARIFSQKLNFGGFLVHPLKLSAEAQKNLVQQLMERFAGIGGLHRPMVLQEGIKFERASMDAKEAQLLEARKWQIITVAMRWRVPLFLLGIEEKGQDADKQMRLFAKVTIRPWVRRIEQAIRRDLIIAKGAFSAKFNMDAIERADIKVRAEVASLVLGSGGSPAVMTQNEVRRILFGLNPHDDPRADILGVGTNPRTDEPVALAHESPKAITDDTPRGRADRLVRKEVAAVNRAMRRFAGSPDDFRAWAAAFYGGHVSTAMETLGIPKEAARVYCKHQRDELLGSDDIEATLADWQERVPGEIASALDSPAPELETMQ